MSEVTVRYRDDALIALIVHAARQVEGVVRLQRRPVSTVTRRLVAKARQPARRRLADGTAVDLARRGDGSLGVEVRIVTRLEPAPRLVVAAVVDAVRASLAKAGEDAPDIEVTVSDVRR